MNTLAPRRACLPFFGLLAACTGPTLPPPVGTDAAFVFDVGSEVAQGGCPDSAGPQCKSAADCDDGLACTTDSCGACGTCSHVPVADRCVVAGQCWQAGEGPQPCIVCEPAQSQTGLTLLSGKPCDDGNPCTYGEMCDAAGQCLGTAKPGCCQKAADCDDGDACTTDLCKLPAGTCTSTAKSADCCSKGACCNVDLAKVKPAGTVCGSAVLAKQYACQGADVRVRTAHAGCNGKSPEGCSEDLAALAWADWQTLETCPAGEACILQSTEVQPICAAPGTGPCTLDADCADSYPCSLPFCNGGTCQNQPQPQGAPCGKTVTATEYGCDGNTLQKRDGMAACDGVGLLCDELGSEIGWGPWQPLQACPASTTCQVDDPTQPGTCQTGGPSTKCQPGTTCCGADGNYAAKGTKCGSSQLQKKYFCGGSGNGSDVMLTYAYAGCTGYSTSCSSSSSYLSWVTETYKSCSSFQKCEVKSATSAGSCVQGDKCTPGTTCCPDGQYAAKGTKCGSSVVKKLYSCSGPGKGATIYVQEAYAGCTGSSTSCSSSSSYLSWGPPETYKKCSSSTFCTLGSGGTSASCK